MIHPVILCGGTGTRLWPLSRQSYPKQFVPMLGEQSLLGQCIERVGAKEFAPPVVVTNTDFRFVVRDIFSNAGVSPEAILIEPSVRNTAPAVLAAIHRLSQSYSHDELVLVLPSDHNIPDFEEFQKTVLMGVEAAQDGKIVTFGIKPDRPETGYGYLEVGALEASSSARELKRFVEKPNAERAEQMVDSGNFLWNSGMFLASIETFETAFKTHAPHLVAPISASVEAAEEDLGFLRLNQEEWDRSAAISLDYAIMEKADNLAAVAYSAEWSDMGDWQAVWRESDKDEHGNVASENATQIDCSGTLLRSGSPSMQVVGIGLKDTLVMAMPDATLVVDASRSQDVKLAVEMLKERNVPQATQLPIDHRPWGWFESLAVGERFQVKRIVVRPKASLSLQSHHHRAEHWIVVKGTAKVTIGETEQLVSENQSVYIPLGEKHRLENPGKVEMVLIEVQTGSYLGEDDIVRYHDEYARQ